jgi:hypothetical protein
MPDALAQSVIIHLSTATGGNATGKLATDLTCQYRRSMVGPMVPVVLDDATAFTDAHVPGNVIEVNEGDYKLDLPDAALATGVDTTEVYLTAAATVQTNGAYLIDFAWANALASGTYSPVLQHDIDPSFVWRLPRRLSGVVSASYALSIYVGETPSFAFDFSKVLESKPRLITAIGVVPADTGLDVDDSDDEGGAVGVRDYLAMSRFQAPTAPGTYTVQMTVEAFSGETVSAEGVVVVSDVAT